MKITIKQVFNGYCDAEVYGIVVTYEVEGKEQGSYVEFDRKTQEINDLEFYEGDDAKRVSGTPGEVQNEVAKAAREYIARVL
jgi:hypothetical protein